MIELTESRLRKSELCPKSVDSSRLTESPLTSLFMEGRGKASVEGTSSPYVPPQNQEVTSYLHLQNSRRKASLTSRRGGVSKSASKANLGKSFLQIREIDPLITGRFKLTYR